MVEMKDLTLEQKSMKLEVLQQRYDEMESLKSQPGQEALFQVYERIQENLLFEFENLKREIEHSQSQGMNIGNYQKVVLPLANN